MQTKDIVWLLLLLYWSVCSAPDVRVALRPCLGTAGGLDGYHSIPQKGRSPVSWSPWPSKSQYNSCQRKIAFPMCVAICLNVIQCVLSARLSFRDALCTWAVCRGWSVPRGVWISRIKRVCRCEMGCWRSKSASVPQEPRGSVMSLTGAALATSAWAHQLLPQFAKQAARSVCHVQCVLGLQTSRHIRR